MECYSVFPEGMGNKNENLRQMNQCPDRDSKRVVPAQVLPRYQYPNPFSNAVSTQGVTQHCVTREEDFVSEIGTEIEISKRD